MEGARDPRADARRTNDKGWRARFEQQVTPQKLEPVYVYAARRAEMISALGGRVDDPEELVNAAIADTLAGDIAWDPDRMSLAQHLSRTIRGRTKNEVLRTERFRHDSIDESVEIDDEESYPVEAEASLVVYAEAPPGPHRDLVSAASRVLAALRDLAANDALVLTLLDAYEDEVCDRAEIIAERRMSESEYDNARRRLVRLVEQLPAGLRRQARAAIG